MRFFLIDRITKIELNKSIEGIKAWSLDNPVFQDHFPGQPIVPGVLLTESMAQILGVLIEKSYYQKYGNEHSIYSILSIIQKAKFRKMVIPGDQTHLKAELSVLDSNRAVGNVEVYVEEELRAQATLSFFIANHNMVKYNKYLERREEYLQIILKDIE